MPEIAVFETLPAAPAPPQAHSDAQLIEIWLHGRLACVLFYLLLLAAQFESGDGIGAAVRS